MGDSVKGFEPMLTAGDVARIIVKPVRFVRGLLKSGSLPAVKFGGNSYRVDPDVFREWRKRGATGFRFARPSGGKRRERTA